MKKITVILCTYNRSMSLSTALDSVAEQRMPEAAEWEVIVVDNNSGDQTRSVVESYCAKYPGRFRYLFEGQQGLSRARNAGIREAAGEIMAFMDDDVAVDAMWLQNLTSRLQDGQWAGAGGPVRPPKEFHPPQWLVLGGQFDLGGALALIDLGTVPGEWTRPPYGTNMAYRKEMFEKYGLFRTDLGRCGTSLVSNEDTEFGRRLLSGGEHLSYEPHAIVYHPVPAERLKPEYFRSWWFNYGRARVLERGTGPAIFGVPRKFFSLGSQLLRYFPARLLQWLLTVDQQRRFYKKCQFWLTVGEIAETYRPSHETKNSPSNLPSGSLRQL